MVFSYIHSFAAFSWITTLTGSKNWLELFAQSFIMRLCFFWPHKGKHFANISTSSACELDPPYCTFFHVEENITPPGFAIMLTQTVLSIKLVSLQAAMSHLILDQQQHPDQTHPRIRRKVLNLNSPVFNSRSIVNKRLELSSLLALKSYELVAITKTFLDSTINSSEMFSDTFNVQRRDRSRHGGGVLLAVHQGLCCIRKTDFKTDCEILWSELIATKPFSRVLVGVFYRPPSSDIDYLKELERSLSLIERSGNNLSILLLGDFNLPQIVWSTPSPTCPDSLSSTFCTIIVDYFFHQLVLQPTREQSILDLVFITAPELVKDLEICQPVGGSDHCSTEFNLKLKFQRPKRSCSLVYNYRAADWLGLREDFCNLQWDCSYLMEWWWCLGCLEIIIFPGCWT